jgi:hypothetical protein
VSRISRQLAPLLIGVIASVSGLWSAQCFRVDDCLDRGGRWDAAVRVCQTAGGAPHDLGARPYLLGGLVAVVLLGALWRTYAFFTLRRAARGRPPG